MRKNFNFNYRKMGRHTKDKEVSKSQIVKDYKKMLENKEKKQEGKLLLSPEDIAVKNGCSSVYVYMVLKEKGIKIK